MKPASPEKPVSVSIVRKSAGPEENPSPPDPAPTLLAFGRPPTAGERFTHWITRPFVTAPLVIICVALLGWSIFLRWPQQLTRVQARLLPNRASVITPTMEEVAMLRGQVAVGLRPVLSNPDQMPRLISILEQKAHILGFVTELTTRPVEIPIPGIPEFASHRVVLRLENNYDREAPAFRRLVQWLQQLPELEVKADVVTLNIQSLGDGVTTATVEIDFPTFQPDAKTASK